MKQSLFGHLVHNFTSHPENLATEALAYILNRSRVAMEALSRFLASTGAAIPSELYFQTQVADCDNAIPDLVGVSKENERAVIVEAKFWAGLTDNQPVTYLRRGPRLLVFISPARRLPTLWAELLTRCRIAGLIPQPTIQVQEELRVAQLSPTQFIAATSWRLVLNCLFESLSSLGDLDAAADVRQLQGLCDQMDVEAFLPLRSEELAPAIAIRTLQLNEIVDAITDELVQRGIASTTGFRATPIYGGYIRYMRVGSFGWMLQVNARYWSNLRETPLWLNLKNIPEKGNWLYSREARELLSPLELETPPRLIQEADNVLIPLTLPFGVEQSRVIDDVLHQLLDVAERLQTGVRRS